MPYASLTLAAVIQMFQWYGYTYECDGDRLRASNIFYYQ